MGKSEQKGQEGNVGGIGENLQDSGGSFIKSWSSWQFLDSLLPTGGFAHSCGLEASFHAGAVRESSQVELFSQTALENAGSTSLPFVRASFQVAERVLKGEMTTEQGVHQWALLDSHFNSTLTNHVAQRASVAQGTALLRVAASVWKEASSLLSAMRVRARAQLTRDESQPSGVTVQCHHCCVFGVVAAICGMDVENSQRAFLFLCLRDVLSAATRLNLMGPLQAAILQHKMAPRAEALLQNYKNRPLSEIHQSTPLLDILQGGHDSLFSRLFSS